MRRLLGPAFLFGIASILIALPGLLNLAAPPHPPPRVNLRLEPPLRPPIPHDAVIVRAETLSLGEPGFRARRFATPFSGVIFATMPLFALCYAGWPRWFKRSLRPGPGRWHFVLATFPTVLTPLLAFVLLPVGPLIFLRLGPPRPDGTTADAMLRLTDTALSGVQLLVIALWFVGLAIFALNVQRTLRDDSAGET